MVFRINVRKKGTDSIPEKAESFVKNDTGPLRRNLVIPKEAQNVLIIKENKGTIEISVSASP